MEDHEFVKNNELTSQDWNSFDIPKKMDLRLDYLANEWNLDIQKKLKKGKFSTLTNEKQAELLKKYPVANLKEAQINNCLATYNIKLVSESINTEEAVKSKVFKALSSSNSLKRYTNQIDKLKESRTTIQTIPDLDPILLKISARKIIDRFTDMLTRFERLSVFKNEPEVKIYLENIVKKIDEESEKKFKDPKTSQFSKKSERELKKIMRKNEIYITRKDLHNEKSNKTKILPIDKIKYKEAA